MLIIWGRELRNYFLTPIGYVFTGIFLLVGGILFMIHNVMSASSDLMTMFGNLVYLFMILTPLLTMRLISEERHERTDQLLLTSPVSIWNIVGGKFLAACSVLALALMGTIPMIAVIARYATPYPGLILSHYIGFFLLGCSYIAIGVAISALTENQVSAAVLTFGANLALQFVEAVGPSLLVPNARWINTLFSWVSLQRRYDTFATGMVSFANILYYLTFCLVLVFLAVRAIDRRRWSEG